MDLRVACAIHILAGFSHRRVANATRDCADSAYVPFTRKIGHTRRRSLRAQSITHVDAYAAFANNSAGDKAWNARNNVQCDRQCIAVGAVAKGCRRTLVCRRNGGDA